MASYVLAENGDRILSEDGLNLTIMEELTGGLTQPGGNGGDIVMEDDAHGDAARDLVSLGAAYSPGYSDEDVYLKVVAFGWKAVDGITLAVEKTINGTLPHYQYHVNIQNGDGVGSTVTSWAGARHSTDFDPGKTYKVSAIGLTNRWIKFGRVLDDGVNPPFGYDGVDVTFGASIVGAPSLGNYAIYGSHLRLLSSAAGVTLALARNSTSQEGDLVDSVLEAIRPNPGNCGVNVGSSSVSSRRAFGNKFSSQGGTGATFSGVTIFNVDDAQRNDMGGSTPYLLTPGNTRCFAQDLLLSGSPTIADFRGSTLSADLKDITWTRRAAQIASVGTTSDYRTYSPTFVDSSGVPQAGKLIEVLGGTQTVVVSATTDSNGQISFSVLGVYGQTISNAVKVRTNAAGVWTEKGPFTTRVDGVKCLLFTWPRVPYTVGATTYDQLLPVRDVIIVPETLKANFSINPGGGQPPLTCQFTDRSTTAYLEAITAWAWDFGDTGTSTVQNPTHVYAAAGSYAVTLTVTDSAGRQATLVDTAAVVTAPIGLTAGFSVNPGGGVAPLTVAFTDRSLSPTGILTRAWTFGDGGTSTLQNPTHMYAAGGTYTVSLTVTDASGSAIETDAGAVVVSAPLAPVTVDQVPLAASGEIRFEGLVSAIV